MPDKISSQKKLPTKYSHKVQFGGALKKNHYKTNFIFDPEVEFWYGMIFLASSSWTYPLPVYLNVRNSTDSLDDSTKADVMLQS